MNVRKEALTFAYIINLEQKNLHKIYEATPDNKYFHISAGILENPTAYELSSIACYTDADMAPSLTK